MKRNVSRRHLYRLSIAALLSSSASFAAPQIGFYAWDAPDGPNTGLDARATWLGRSVDVGLGATNHDTWTDVEGASWAFSAWSNWVQKDPAYRKYVLTVYILPGKFDGSGPDGIKGTADDPKLSACAAGQYDSHYKALANNLATYHLTHNTVLRLGHESTGNWFAWSVGSGGPQAGQYANYAACFRHIVTVMRAAQPTATFQFDWNATPEASSSVLAATYPGDAYVDYITEDPYDSNWDPTVFPYPATCDAACRLSHQQKDWSQLVVKLNVLRDFAKLHNKKMGFSEWGVWAWSTAHHGGGDNPYYIQQMYNYIMDPNNNFGYEIYFDVKAPDGDHQISNADTQFPQSAAMFKKLFGSMVAPSPSPSPKPSPSPSPSPKPSPSPSPSASPSTLTVSFVSGSASPTSVPQGTSVAITGTVKANMSAAAHAIFKVLDASNNVVNSQTVDVTLSNSSSIAIRASYAVPPTLAIGTYHVSMDLESSDWTKKYFYNASIASFSVVKAVSPSPTPSPLPSPSPSPSPSITVSVTFGSTTVSPTSVARGGTVKVTTTVKSNVTITNANIEFGVMDPSFNYVGGMVKYVMTLNAGQTYTLSPTFTIPSTAATGAYTPAGQVYNSAYTKKYIWTKLSKTFSVY